MGVMLDCNWRRWNGRSSSVGWPQGADAGGWAYQRMEADAGEYAAAGFAAIRMPPSCRGGAGVFSAGYDKYDDYNLDGTAYGDGAMLKSAVDAFHAFGMQAYGDLVLHQYGGGTAEGYYRTLRFPKTPSCFVGAPPRVAVDPVPDQNGNFAFGDMVSYVHSTPAGYMREGAIAAAQWLIQQVGFDGLRIDDVKGTHAGTVYDILTAPGMARLFAFGEYFDGNPTALSAWVNGDMKRRAAVLDFAFHFNVGSICNNSSRSWMGALADIGWCTKDAATAVTFVESADTDNSPGQQIIWNKLLGYAVLLTFPGYPSVYYRDWSTDAGCYGLKRDINNLVWVHNNLAQGEFVPRVSDQYQVFVHERMGAGRAPGCIAGFNNDQYSRHVVRAQTRHPPGTRLHEYSGNAGYNSDLWTDSQGCITMTMPRNDNGRGYLVYAPWVA